MKKLYFIATALLITLGACTNDESDPGQEITFKSVNQKSTKANFYGPMTTVTYAVNEHFGVFAYYQEESTSSGSVFMNNVEIQKNVSEWKSAGTKYYWPTEGSLTFACYSPYDFIEGSEAENVSATVDGISFANFIASTDNEKQIDLMVSDIVTPPTNSGAVAVTFKHILSQIKFTAKTNTNYHTGTNVNKIEIDNVIVHQLGTKGNYASVNGTFDWSLSNPSVTGDYTVLSSSKTIELDGTTTVNIAEPILIIPQDATLIKWGTPSKDIFEIQYTVTFKEGETYTTSEKTVYIQPKVEWVKGKIYIYNLEVGLNEITFTPTVQDWAADTDTADGEI